MKITAKLSTKQDATGKSEIILSCYPTIQSKTIHLTAKSGIWVNKQFFDVAKAEIVVPSNYITAKAKYHIEEKKKLDGLIDYLTDKIKELGRNKSALNNVWFKETVAQYMNPTDNQEQNEFWNNAKDYVSRIVNKTTRDNVNVVFRFMWRYEQYMQVIKSEDFNWGSENLDKKDIAKFTDYLKKEKDIASVNKTFFKEVMGSYPHFLKGGANCTIRKRGIHCIEAKEKLIKTFFNYLVDYGLASHNPFRGYKIESYPYADPIVITIDERNKLASTQMPTKDLELARDRFVFQSFIGCRIGDLENMTYANINGNRLTFTPHKTSRSSGVEVELELMPTALKILEKYKSNNNDLFPFMERHKYNELVKQCCEIAGLTRQVATKDTLTGETIYSPICEVVSSHFARKAFVGNLQEQNVPMQVVASMSGHSANSREIARYFKVSEKQKSEAIKKLESNEEKKTLDLSNLTSEQIAAIMAIIGGRH